MKKERRELEEHSAKVNEQQAAAYSVAIALNQAFCVLHYRGQNHQRQPRQAKEPGCSIREGATLLRARQVEQLCTDVPTQKPSSQ